MKKIYLYVFPFILLFFSTLEISAEYEENMGIIRTDTKMYVTPDCESSCLGEIRKNSRVGIVSVLSDYMLVNYNKQYAYISNADVAIHPLELGEKMPYISPYNMLITEGNLYESSVDILMSAYSAVPLQIRRVFEEKGFLIKMTEWDITKEAYEEYGGYYGIGKIQAVLDFEKKILYVNDEYPNAVIHEMGHFVNDYLQMYSSREENKEKFFTEAEKISSYAKENEREFFAESFRLYVTEPQLLQLMSPLSYKMVDNAVKLVCTGSV